MFVFVFVCVYTPHLLNCDHWKLHNHTQRLFREQTALIARVKEDRYCVPGERGTAGEGEGDKREHEYQQHGRQKLIELVTQVQVSISVWSGWPI